MSGITPSLLQRLQKTLLRCAPFSSDQVLQAIFVDSRLSQWKADLPEATSDAERVHLTVEYLSDKHNAVGENGLVLFLYVLRDHASPGDNCHHDLGQLAAELEQRAPTPDTALERYRERVKKLHGTMRILGKYESVSLEGIYTDVYLLDQPAASRYVDPSTLPERIKGERQDGIELVKHLDTQALVILGKPGAGKTTFLKHIALQAAEGQLGDRVPIFIALREWADDDDLLDVLTEPFAGCGLANPRAFVEHLLETERSLLLLDALDEVGEESARHNLIKALERFSRRYLDCHILLTCRTAATPYQFERAKTVEVANFTDDQMRAFATNWFGENTAKVDKFQKQIEQDEHLRDLGRTPLLLGMLCLTFDKRGNFPQKRADLYEQALEILLVRWDKSRYIERDAARGGEIYYELSSKRKHQLFAYIAYITLERGEMLIPQKQLERLVANYLATIVPYAFEQIDIEVSKVLKAIEAQHGILIECAQRLYSFIHSTFQEYYAAYYIIKQFESGNTQAISYLLSKAHWHCWDFKFLEVQAHWREVILLTAGMLNRCEVFFECFMDILDTLIRNKTKLVKFLAWITRKAQFSPERGRYKTSAIRSIYASMVLGGRYSVTALRDSLLEIPSRSETQHKSVPNDEFAFIEDVNQPSMDILANPEPWGDIGVDLELIELLSYYCPPEGPSSGLIWEFLDELQVARDVFLERQEIELYHAVFSLENPIRKFQNVEWEDLLIYNRRQVYHMLSRDSFECSAQNWLDFIASLRFIARKYRDIGYIWAFTEEQTQVLEDYFYITCLVVECLKVANISDADRSAIEDRLLLPPGYSPEDA